jgi:hypothetical protein
MRVIGVTTTLSPEDMATNQPDKVFDSITSIRVADLATM